MTTPNESFAITFKRLDLFSALGRHYNVEIFSANKYKLLQLYFYTYGMVGFTFVCIYPHMPRYS